MHALRERMLTATLAAGTPLAVLRPTLIFGPGDTHNSYGANRFMRAAAADRRVPLFGQGEEQRDHVFVDDVVRIVQLVLERRSSGTLNLVTGRNYLIIAKNILPPQSKSLDEIRGMVISDYQNFLEHVWVETLKKKYKTTINNHELEKIYLQLGRS